MKKIMKCFGQCVLWLSLLSSSVLVCGNDDEGSKVEPSAVAPEGTNGQPRVETPEGVVYLGDQHTTARQGRRVYAFTNIPYAAPPLGDLRFRKPFPPLPFSSPYNATGEAPSCLHWDNLTGRGPVGQEDCLYLNVYTHNIPKAPTYPNTQPIVVFLHAGTWMAGGGGSNGLLQPDYLLENDVMVVTVNHRLGPFGFLSTGDGESPGNYGLMDQVRALEWVRDNGRYFGGMNDSVTIMGSGAGGSSVHLLILSPWTRGASIYQDEYCLMHRAISHSGTAYSPHAIVRNPKTQALRLGVQVGCGSPDDTKALMACLRSLPASNINDNIPALYEWDDEPPPFGAVIDSWQGDEAFLPDEPHHLIRHRQFLQVPWLMGTNKDDGAFRVQDILQDSSLTASLNKDWDKYGPLLLNLKATSCKDPKEMARDIRKYYMGSKKFGHESTIEFVEMMTDRFFLYPTEHAANDHCYYLKGQYCYRYQLVYSGRKSFLDVLNKETPYQQTSSLLGGRGASNPRFQNTRDAQGWGVSFLDELLYLFPSPRLGLVYKQDFNADSASRISTHMIMFWTNFIKGSDPTPQLNGWPDDVSPWGAWWEPYYPNYNYWLQIDPEMETKDEQMRSTQMSFWGDLPLFENRDNNVIRDEL